MMTVGQLETFALSATRPGDHVVLDLTDVSFLDCSGLRALLRVHHRYAGVAA